MRISRHPVVLSTLFVAEVVMSYIIRDFVQTWYGSITADREVLANIELVLTHAVGVFVKHASSVQPLRFLCDDVCEALRLLK